MSALQELGLHEIGEVIQLACAKRTPITITLRDQRDWINLHGCLVERDAQHVVIEPHPEIPWPLTPTEGQTVGISLKLKHHKYVFMAVVASGPDHILTLERPARMQRLQRRAYLRADIPPGCIVRASFWLGCRQSEPMGASPDRPVWSGRLSNLSAGGFMLNTSDTSVDVLEEGDQVGVRLLFGAGQEAIYADASIRHVDVSGLDAEIGFQFVGLEQSEEGKNVLATIGQKVVLFQKRTGSFDKPRARVRR